MTPVKDKAHEVLTGLPDSETPLELNNTPEAGAVEKRGVRRTGIVLVVVGCALMALAAGEAAADTSPWTGKVLPQKLR